MPHSFQSFFAGPFEGGSLGDACRVRVIFKVKMLKPINLFLGLVK